MIQLVLLIVAIVATIGDFVSFGFMVTAANYTPRKRWSATAFWSLPVVIAPSAFGAFYLGEKPFTWAFWGLIIWAVMWFVVLTVIFMRTEPKESH